MSHLMSSTLLLLSIVHPDLKDGRALVTKQCGGASGCVQFVNAAASVLVPEQEVAIMAQTEGVVQFLTFIHRLMADKKPEGNSCLMVPKASYNNLFHRKNISKFIKKKQ